MRLKNIVLIGTFVLYGAYYVGVSKGFIKKNTITSQGEREISYVQQVIDVVTPLSPEERRIELKERLSVLKMQLSAAEANLASYEKWRANALSNPPS
ncbi:MAG: hypothetical protein ABFD82_16640 [Syntrophaceae bacterium]